MSFWPITDVNSSENYSCTREPSELVVVTLFNASSFSSFLRSSYVYVAYNTPAGRVCPPRSPKSVRTGSLCRLLPGPTVLVTLHALSLSQSLRCRHDVLLFCRQIRLRGRPSEDRPNCGRTAVCRGVACRGRGGTASAKPPPPPTAAATTREEERQRPSLLSWPPRAATTAVAADDRPTTPRAAVRRRSTAPSTWWTRAAASSTSGPFPRRPRPRRCRRAATTKTTTGANKRPSPRSRDVRPEYKTISSTFLQVSRRAIYISILFCRR